MPFAYRLFLALFISLISYTTWAQSTHTPLSYNPGPDPYSEIGRQLIDLYATQPEYSVMSDELMDNQKFRYVFGLMMTRSNFESDQTKILFIGQDATHIAEASKQPGTSGFGGRVQSVANYFGVDYSVATTNAFLSTIKGQYGSYNHVYVDTSDTSSPQIKQISFVDNLLWLLSHSEYSEIRKKREAYFEWLIKYNPNALKLVVLFGNAASDAFAHFLISRGAEVKPKFSFDQLKSTTVPVTKLVPAGGNNEFSVPLTVDNKDIYEILVGRPLDYTKIEDQELALNTLKEKTTEALDLMVFTGGGLYKSGIVHPAQLGGYDLKEVYINGQKTNSLKGLVLSDGTVVANDIGFATSIHPTALSRLAKDKGIKAASNALNKSFEDLNQLKAQGWYIEPDIDTNGQPMTNDWHEEKPFNYGRGEVGPSFFEFGAPDDRRANQADATRFDPQTIIIGSRNSKGLDKNAIEKAKEGLPSKTMNPDDLWSVRPRTGEAKYIFDRGPGENIALSLINALDKEKIFAPKDGEQTFDKNNKENTFNKKGIAAYNAKTHADTGFFGFHRGDFYTSEALILADPHGLDDWITSRALTGARGQYLNSLMYSLGIDDKYLVLKTVPFGMDDANSEEWETIRQLTEGYREIAIEIALRNKNIKYIFTDGPIAAKEMTRVLNQLGHDSIKVINIDRKPSDIKSGFSKAYSDAKKAYDLSNVKPLDLYMQDIPRAHLTWWSRIWEGTTGDRVIEVNTKEKGRARLLITPNWVARQNINPLPSTLESIKKIKEQLSSLNLRISNQSAKDFLESVNHSGEINSINKTHDDKDNYIDPNNTSLSSYPEDLKTEDVQIDKDSTTHLNEAIGF